MTVSAERATDTERATDRDLLAPPHTAVADEDRWPDVARLPRGSRARAAVTALLLRRAFARMPLCVQWGASRASRASRATPATGSGPVLRVRDPEAFFRRIGATGLVGFGESYMAGEWDADDLVGVLTVLATHVDELVPAPLRRLRGLWARRRPAEQLNTVTGARDNIRRHYDLSNDLFGLFLDPTMSYSSAVFPTLPATGADFAAAQHHKIDLLLDLAEVGPGTRLLEIGTGWGELALRAAERGATVLTVTLSAEQRHLAMSRLREAGVADRVTVELCDYRHVRGTYDAVVSVEMIEAVGADYWPVYFSTLRERLAPGGRIALQTITMPHERMLATGRTHTWISKYIFPGGLIPSLTAVERESAAAGLSVGSDHGYGEHYAETLRLWRERFAQEARSVDALGFDLTFRRMWELYLAYSEAGFRAKYLDVRQLLLTESTTTRGAVR